MLAAVFGRDTKQKKMELEAKHLAPYLPFKLKMIFEGKEGRVIELSNITMSELGVAISGGTGGMWLNHSQFLPILRPLSEFGDSDNLREVHEFIGLGGWCEAYDHYFDAWFNDACSIDKLVLQAPYEVIQYFFSNHFDVFGLIKKGIAVDVNTLSANGS